jgi:hypothetical protein
MGVVGDTGFEPVTSTVSTQKEEGTEIIKGDLCKNHIFQAIRFSIYFGIFVYICQFLTYFGCNLGTILQNLVGLGPHLFSKPSVNAG